MRRDRIDMRMAAAVDLQQPQAGGEIARHHARRQLLAVGERHHHRLRAHNHVIDGDDHAIVADDRAGAAPIGAEPDRNRRMRLWDLAVDAHGRARNPLEYMNRRVHGMDSGFTLAGPINLSIRENASNARTPCAALDIGDDAGLGTTRSASEGWWPKCTR